MKDDGSVVQILQAVCKFILSQHVVTYFILSKGSVQPEFQLHFPKLQFNLQTFLFVGHLVFCHKQLHLVFILLDI